MSTSLSPLLDRSAAHPYVSPWQVLPEPHRAPSRRFDAELALAELFPDLRAAADAALADLFPALRLRSRAGAGAARLA